MTEPQRDDENIAGGYLVRLSGRVWGLVLGLLMGLGLFAATNILVLKGGDDVGTHLGLLCQYFPGYDVNFTGSLLGFLYAFVLGYLLGHGICAVYNAVARRR